MTANKEAVQAAAEALSEYYEGDGWGYFGGAAEAAVAAAAPILLAAERTRIAAAIRAKAQEPGEWIGPTDPDRILRYAARIAEPTPEEGP